MPKESAIGGQLWEQYSDKVAERMANPRYLGEVSAAEAAALGCTHVAVEWGAEACGDSVRLYWAVDPATHTVVRARFHSFGCGSAIASCDAMCELCEGSRVDDVLRLTNVDVERVLRDVPALPAVPPQKMHCSVMAHDVLRRAVAAYKGVPAESLEDSEILCRCARATVGFVRDAIRRHGLTTVEEVARYTKAGAFCRSCVCPGGHERRSLHVVDILDEERRERERVQGRMAYFAGVDDDDERVEMAQRVVDADVAPLLSPAVEEETSSSSSSWKSRCDVVQVDARGDGSFGVLVRCSGPCAATPEAHVRTIDLINEKLRHVYGPNIEAIL